jgi:outer membrane protein OmpA-like peptidoglycan-associated protein
LIAAHGGGEALAADIQGSRDHSLISRYQGAQIAAYEVRDFDEHVIGLGPAKEVSHPKYEFSKKQVVEGKVTRILYSIPATQTSLQVMRNYQQALQGAGFQQLWSCGGDDCGRGMQLAPPYSRQITTMAATWFDKNRRYLSARLARPEGDVYVGLMVYEYSDKETRAWLDVVETRPMKTGMVRITAESLAKDIRARGRVEIYEIYFDTDSDKLKPESDAALKEVARLMKEQSALKVFIVGHTDMTGSFEHNLDLSRRRAQAVADALARRFGVDAARVAAHGVGPLAPVASNESQQGKALNRRVELVAR